MCNWLVYKLSSLEESPKLINAGPTFIPDYRVIDRLFDLLYLQNLEGQRNPGTPTGYGPGLYCSFT